MNSLVTLPEDFQRGIQQHRRIDAYTDSHPIVRQSVQRVPPPFRRYGGILTDLFYDHFLARDWPDYSPELLSDFTREIYESFSLHQARLPAEAYAHLERLRSNDWLSAYQEVSGVARALERISARLKRPVNLEAAIFVLEDNYESFHTDFRAFFPDLQIHVRH